MNFVLDRCSGKSVLHLGCSGGDNLNHWLGRGRECVLHIRLGQVARDLHGVDMHESSLRTLQDLGFLNLHLGNVEELEHVKVQQVFEIVLAGDLLEHLSNPGRMLDGIHRFMGKGSELILSTPNAFGLPNFMRYSLRRFRDGPEHVATFNPDNMANLLHRHGYDLSEMYTGYDRPAKAWSERLEFLAGAWFLRLKPEHGGTLIAVAKSKRSPGARPLTV